jgi:hypothetical protein
MPGSGDKFTNVRSPGAVTVIRKGSKYGDVYAKETENAARYMAEKHPEDDKKLARKVARTTGAVVVGNRAEQAARLFKSRNKNEGEEDQRWVKPELLKLKGKP